MIFRAHQPGLTPLLLLLTAMILSSIERVEAAVSGDISSAISTSSPKLAAGTTEWEPFGPLIGHPKTGKDIVVNFISDLGIPSTLVSSGAVDDVTLWPNPASEINCKNQSVPPFPTGDNPATECYFQIVNAGTTSEVRINYYGSFTIGQNIRYRIQNLTTIGDPTFNSFDTSAIPGVPQPQPESTDPIPVRLAIVIDKSGSMGWSSTPGEPGCSSHASPPPPGCGPSRWEVLIPALQQMLVIMQANALPGDEFAVTVFDGSANVLTTPAFSSIDADAVNSAFDAVSLLSPSGSTSIGGGLCSVVNSSAIRPLESANHRNVILLFSDGAQNVQPFITVIPGDPKTLQLRCEPAATEQLAVPQDLSPSLNAAYSICPFILNADDPAGFGPIPDIADIGCGNFYLVAPELANDNSLLEEYMVNVVNQAMHGDKLELTSVHEGAVNRSAASGIGETEKLETLIANDVIAINWLLNWDRVGNGIRALTLSKDGVEFSVPLGQSNGSLDARAGLDSVHLSIREPFCNQAGDCTTAGGIWTLEFVPFFEVSDTFNYSLLTTEDNASIATRFSIEQPQPGVNNPIVLEVELREGGQPLTGLPAGAVQATLARPDLGLGNVLSDGASTPGSTVDTDPLQGSGLKFSAMLNSSGERELALRALLPNNASSTTLIESSPGVYSATIADVPVEGAYQVEFSVAGTTPTNADFVRTRRQTYSIVVQADAAATLASASTFNLSPCALALCATTTFTPVDAAGNRLGPGKSWAIRLSPNPSQSTTALVDSLDGSYSISYECQDAVDCNPQLVIADAPLGALPSPGKTGSGNTRLWWFLILLLILVIVIIWVVRSSRP